MSLCLACALTTGPNWAPKPISKAVRCVLQHASGRSRVVSRNVAARRTWTRSASTSSTFVEVPSAQHKTLTVLHKTRSLASDILKSRYEWGLWESWNQLLEQAHDDLSALHSERQEGRNARVLVYGCDKFSGSADFITALLEDPISISGSQNETIRQRWKARPSDAPHNFVEIETGRSNSVKDEKSKLKISISSSWLQQFPVPLQLMELAPHNNLSSKIPSSHPLLNETWRNLYAADVPVIICNPLTTPLTTFINRDLPLPLNPNSIIIFVSPSHTPEVHSQILAHIAQIQHERLYPSPFSTIAEAERKYPVKWRSIILFIDPTRALSAVRTLQADPSSPKAIEKYQHDFAGSNISAFTEALKQIIAAPSPSNSQWDSAISKLRTQTAQAIAEGALQASRTALWSEEQEIASLESELASLKQHIEASKDELPRRVFGTAGESADEIVKALADAEGALREVMNNLTWWRATWRVDEVGQLVAAAVERSWCKQLEDQLIYEAGYLMFLQATMKIETDAILSKHQHPSPFDSSVLRNTLLQISSSPSYCIDPHVLTGPLTSRLEQIVEYPTTRLHLKAQRMVVGMSGSILGGAGAGVASWGGYLNTGPLAWILGHGAMDASTAVGIALLISVVGVRWAVGSWEKAKRVWWKDWARIGEGLRRDLKIHLDRTLREQVLIVPERACAELKLTVTKRKTSLSRSLEELQDLREDLQNLRSPSSADST